MLANWLSKDKTRSWDWAKASRIRSNSAFNGSLRRPGGLRPFEDPFKDPFTDPSMASEGCVEEPVRAKVWLVNDVADDVADDVI